MITIDDRDLITAMVGARFANGYPEDFVAEYDERLGMLARSGSVGGLGPHGIMQLLRDAQVKPMNAPVRVAVSDWREVTIDTICYVDGDRARYKGICGGDGSGTLLIRKDGYNANHEVPKSSVTLAGPTIEGVPEEAFVGVEPTAKERVHMEQEAAEEAGEEPEASEEDLVLNEWINVPPKTPVLVQTKDGEIEAQFIDVDGLEIAVAINDDEFRKYPASQVKLPATA